MEVVAAAASIVQLTSFTAEVLALGYGYLAKAKRAPLEIKTLMRELTGLNELLDQLEELATENKEGSMRAALEALEKLGTFEDCKGMVKVVQKSVKACQQIEGQQVKNIGKRLLWPFKDKETKETIGYLGRLRDTLSAAVNVDSSKTLARLEMLALSIDHKAIMALEDISILQDGMSDLKSTTGKMERDLAFVKSSQQIQIQETERNDIRRWLRIDGIESEARYQEALSQRHGATGSWVLECSSFREWLLDQGACMWLYGIAGCGKSVLAATITNSLHESTSNPTNCAVLYFFCDHRDPEKKSFHDLLISLVKQLLDDNEDSFFHIKSWRKVKMADTPSAKPPSTSEYTDLITHLCINMSSVRLVVDAIDESSDPSSFITGLCNLAKSSGISLLLTSRHDVDLARVIDPIAKYRVPVVENMRKDIHEYLAEEIGERLNTGRLKLRDKSLKTQIVAELEKNADGMILIAKLHLDYITRLKSDRAIKEALVRLPSDLYPTYDKILHQICAQHPDEIEDIERILQLLLYSVVPLTLEQVGEVISMRPGDTRLDRSGIATDLLDLAASLGSLVTVSEQETGGKDYFDLRGSKITLIMLAHSSVEEYLRSGKMVPELAHHFCLESELVQSSLAKTCLQYIAFEDFSLPLNMIMHTPVTSGEKKFHNAPRIMESYSPGRHALRLERTELRKRTSSFAFYDYSCRYWPDHISNSSFSKTLDADIIRLLEWFLIPSKHRGKYISWQQMYHHDIYFYCPGRPPLHYAFEFRIGTLVEHLMPPKEKINDLVCGVSALHVAARCGSYSTVASLINDGASIELRTAKDPKGKTSLMTPLHFAAEGGHSDIVKLLIDHGASPQVTNESGGTPFLRAARSGSLKTLKTLYEAGSDIDTQKKSGITPLFEAVAQCRPKIACQLLQWGADPTILTLGGKSALSLLQEAKNKGLLKDYWSRDPARPTPISWSVSDDWVTENEILETIDQIRAKNTPGGTGFMMLLEGLKRKWVTLKQMEKDTRPGTEREKDSRYFPDTSKIVTIAEFLDKDDEDI